MNVDLKDNELAIALGQLNDWRETTRRRSPWGSSAAALLAAAVIGVMTWRNRVEGLAQTMLAEAPWSRKHGWWRRRCLRPPEMPLREPLEPPNSYPTE